MAGLLLDTHIFLWWRQGGQRLQRKIREAIIDSELVFVSSASAWEIAIKRSLGRLQIPGTVAAGIEDSQFSPLLVSLAHADAVAELPFHHRDPFDRMLVAQAQHERLTLVTADRQLQSYDLSILWAG